MIINLPKEKQPSIEHHVEVMVAGAAPPVAVIEGMRNIGINVNHVYGLTETYGPSALCASQAGWSDLSITEQAQLHSRRGVPYPLQDSMRVLDLKRCSQFQMTVKPWEKSCSVAILS